MPKSKLSEVWIKKGTIVRDKDTNQVIIIYTKSEPKGKRT